MRKPELLRRPARCAGIKDAEVADHLDEVVRRVLGRLREGKDVDLPGLGKLCGDPGGKVRFERAGEQPRD